MSSKHPNGEFGANPNKSNFPGLQQDSRGTSRMTFARFGECGEIETDSPARRKFSIQIPIDPNGAMFARAGNHLIKQYINIMIDFHLLVTCSPSSSPSSFIFHINEERPWRPLSSQKILAREIQASNLMQDSCYMCKLPALHAYKHMSDRSI